MKKDTFDDKYYMGIAIRLARKGIGKTSPNPMVGAVIVANGKIIGRGYHKRCGDHHAEINAINNVKTPMLKYMSISTIIALYFAMMINQMNYGFELAF